MSDAPLFVEEFFARNVPEEWKESTRRFMAEYERRGRIIAGVDPCGVVLASKDENLIKIWRGLLVDMWDRVVYKRARRGQTLSLPF